MTDRKLFETFRDQRVLVTGHTGFKGGWLSLWLQELGAHVTGFALPPNTEPNLFDTLDLGNRVDHRIGDVRQFERLAALVEEVAPDTMFHLAAQPIVRRSYRDPRETLTTNIAGTINILEAARQVPSVKAAVIVTSDKCYENTESTTAYREEDKLGGKDPYSCSKAAGEHVVTAYRNVLTLEGSDLGIASVRAGNVIGGGDWAEDRIVPDIMRAAKGGQPVRIRNPAAIRPWQHVLEPLSGYLTVAARLHQPGGADMAQAWNFGPDREAAADVGTLVGMIRKAWGEGAPEVCFGQEATAPKETMQLYLDAGRAKAKLSWRHVLDLQETVAWTVAWYRAHAQSASRMLDLTKHQIDAYQDHLR